MTQKLVAASSKTTTHLIYKPQRREAPTLVTQIHRRNKRAPQSTNPIPFCLELKRKEMKKPAAQTPIWTLQLRIEEKNERLRSQRKPHRGRKTSTARSADSFL